MPLPKPRKGESQSDFMGRCMHEAYGSDAPADRTQEQATAMCLDTWREAHGGKKPKETTAEVQRIIALWCRILAKQADVPEPEEGESKADFMDRCTAELSDLDDPDAQDACELAWEDYQQDAGAAELVIKQTAHDVKGNEFIMSDATPDRFGDVVDPKGWQYDHFKKNPIALFNHDSNAPIGRWRNVRHGPDALRGELELAPKDTSARIDEIRALVEHGILRAVSVGFKPIEREPIEGKGTRYVKSELIECSLVSIPANPNALAVVRSLHISAETQREIFGEHAGRASASVRGEHASKRTSTGKHAETSHNRKANNMTTLSQRIEDTQARIVENTDKLRNHLEGMDQSNVSDAAMETTNKFNADIARDRKLLAMLEDSERSLAATASNNGSGDHRALVVHTPGRTNGSGERQQFTRAADKKIERKELVDAMIRAGVVAYFSKVFGRGADDMRQRIVSEGYSAYDEAGVKAACDLVFRAAVAPADTTTTGWATELVQTSYAAFMDLLFPQSIFPRLSAKGLALSFGRAGKIIIPTRSATPTIAGSFVGEGQPIPVRRAGFAPITLTPKKMAVISTMTREISEHSVPAIETLIRDAITSDTAVAIDSVLIDANAATTVRPAGLLNGVSALTATAGGGVAAVVGDMKQLLGALTTSTKGNIRAPALVINPQEVNTLIWTKDTNTAVFPFRAEVQAGNLGGVPLIDSGTVPTKTVILVDAADFVTAGEQGPMWSVSDVATVHEEDTTPLPIVSGSPGTAASPVRSLWQTDSIGIRMILGMNWAMRRTGMVSWTQNVTW